MFRAFLLLLATVLILPLALTVPGAAADGPDPGGYSFPEKTPQTYPNLSYSLDQMVSNFESRQSTAREAAESAPVSEGPSVAVTVYLSGHVAGAGEWSPTVTVTTLPPVVPGMPTGLTAGISATAAIVDLTWTVPETDGGSLITGYRIESSPDGNGPWTQVHTTAGVGTTYTDDGTDAYGPMFSAGNWPHYRVAAVNSVGTGLFSAPRPAGDPLVARYDANDNGTIEKGEVIAAINDYLFGEGDRAISKGDVIKLINLYLFG